MVSALTLISFAGLAFIMALSPGPNLIYLTSRALCQGRAAGYASLSGVCFGMFLYMLASIAGLSALFDAVPVAYDIVRIVGAGYLLWLAFKAFTTPSASHSTSILAAEPRLLLFRRGLLTCLLNPKIVITYGALLPQFVDPAAGAVTQQLLILGLVQIASAATAHSLVILAAAQVAGLVKRSSRFAGFQRYLLGSVLASLAFKLVSERQRA